MISPSATIVIKRPRRMGSAILEAALVLPVMLSLSFGMIEFGYFFFVKHALQAAARDGARIGVVPSGSNSTVSSTVASALTAAGLQNTGYQVDIQNASTGASLNVNTAATLTPVKVVVRFNWSGIGAGLRPLGMISGSQQVSGSAVMIKE